MVYFPQKRLRFNLFFLLGFGAFEREANGSWHVAETLQEKSVELNTREDALHALAESYLDSPFISSMVLSNRATDVVKLAEDWHTNGVIFHFT